ncbi:hypothetical protein BO71DRAFT_30460 [Aspergillus ellipticus CBS 707.79]|uniref:Uncharacterized protein n=1 Tax=Aspergillus ellipticus CBS 707.79 TaxID=1448320 RepID=A0A319D408_9EURO|nr:hypothetical protein BO71DRAFT_30460 [Aspergillus ellipticus CBS 707.79]
MHLRWGWFAAWPGCLFFGGGDDRRASRTAPTFPFKESQLMLLQCPRFLSKPRHAKHPHRRWNAAAGIGGCHFRFRIETSVNTTTHLPRAHDGERWESGSLWTNSGPWTWSIHRSKGLDDL